MQTMMLTRPAAAAAAAVHRVGGPDSAGDDADDSLPESLDSLPSASAASSRLAASSLDALPPVSLLAPSRRRSEKSPRSAGKARRSLLRPPSRRVGARIPSEASPASGGGGGGSFGSNGAKEIATGNDDGSAATGEGPSAGRTGRSPRLLPLSPKRLFSEGAADPSPSSVASENKETPLKPLPTSVLQQPTQLPSPLTPLTAVKKAPSDAYADAEEISTPRTANSVLTVPEEVDRLEILEHLKQPCIDVGTSTDETEPTNAADPSVRTARPEDNAELQTALDSLQRDLRELRRLGSNDDDSVDGIEQDTGELEDSDDSRYTEFLNMIKLDESISEAAEAKVAAVDGGKSSAGLAFQAREKDSGKKEQVETVIDLVQEEKEEKVSTIANVKSQGDTMSDASAASGESLGQNQSDPDTTSTEEATQELQVWEEHNETYGGDGDCQCLRLPQPLLALLRGDRSAITTPPQLPLQSQEEASCGDVDQQVQQSVESLRMHLAAMTEHTTRLKLPTHETKLILTEVRVIENSLDKISSLSNNSANE